VELLDFGSQNVLFDVDLQETADCWKVGLNTSYGLYGNLIARAVEVAAVEPFNGATSGVEA